MTMTPFQREGLRLLGYGKRESEFLFLVATHSGYFTNHQFKTFAQSESGSVSHAFIRKLLERKHSTYRAYRSGERVYHLFARKVYQAIERENLRTRKKHELEYVKTRLVALDFVLAHPQHRYLETETEKVTFFAKEYNVSPALLPVKLYRARRSAAVTPRYFVDRFPLFLDAATGMLTFTYVDSGAVTLDGFCTHLRAYRSLFEALPAFDFLYLAPTRRSFQAAEAAFQKTVCRCAVPGRSVSLWDYFRLRRAWDTKERVASQDVVVLKEAQERYAGKHVEELYLNWRNGSAKDDDVMRVAQQVSHTSRATFRTIQSGVSLKVFLEQHANSSEAWKDTNESGSLPRVSGDRSGQISGP
jgi:hypothetical protein